jgi:hypothetical protein
MKPNDRQYNSARHLAGQRGSAGVLVATTDTWSVGGLWPLGVGVALSTGVNDPSGVRVDLGDSLEVLSHSSPLASRTWWSGEW